MFAPYQNDAQSMQIGDLIFENQTDKVTVYGDIDIYRNEAGLEQAIKLQKVFTDMVETLQKSVVIDKMTAKSTMINSLTEGLENSSNNNELDKSSDENPSQQQSRKTISNPFS